MKQYQTAIVLGAGAFGTSIAFVLAQNFKRVIIKVRSNDIYEEIKRGENHTYLPGQQIPSEIVPALSWEELKSLIEGEVELVVSGLPTSAIRPFFRENADEVKSFLKKGIPFVSLAKGIDTETLELPDDMFKDYLADYEDQLTYLSGPSFAKEILDKQITLVSLAGRSRVTLLKASEMLQTDFFKCFPTYDIKGVLLGGALKNVLAIAGGIIEGLGYNHNTRAAMITRGIVEMLRFGVVFNARPETFYGYSGMGDLILTSTGELSRNKQFGIEVAKGRKPEEIIKATRSVVEGYKTTKAAYELAQRYDIRSKIFIGMYMVLYKGYAPDQLISELMKMPAKFDGE
ncbi:MAG: NAD(P)-dependent glycerol-3-phosphate dehydrogenase [Bacteriovoracaceae bacterium]|nr:NAD(P)-dependent glycerol-3-phosphate dehydrogenase [Bacteriovoracaceae bacterium]